MRVVVASMLRGTRASVRMAWVSRLMILAASPEKPLM